MELACCPKTGVAFGLAPKVGFWEGVAVKGDPKDEPNEGVWLAPNPPEGAELNAKGDGAAEGAEDETAEGAVAPKPKDGVAAGGAALAGAPKMKG